MPGPWKFVLKNVGSSTPIVLAVYEPGLMTGLKCALLKMSRDRTRSHCFCAHQASVPGRSALPLTADDSSNGWAEIS